MKSDRGLNIWLGHSYSHLMDCTGNKIETKAFPSKFPSGGIVDNLNKSESLAHYTGRQGQSTYFRQLGEENSNYGNAALFDLADIKTELYNVLRADHRLEKKC